MSRHKDVTWNLPERIADWDEAIVGLLMDIRDEMKRLNSLLHCHNFTDIPHILRDIRKQTKKRKYRRKK